MSRPKIPAATVRQLLFESGHRCAICGTPCPLEYAHIISWKRTRDHSPENLICLCANCHERADRERWGEKTLRQYKETPWVHRQFSTPEADPGFDVVELVIRKEIRDFDTYQEQMLRYALAQFLKVDPEDIEIIAKKEGSIRLVLKVPSGDAERLDRAFREERDLLQDSLTHFPLEEARSVFSGSLPAAVLSEPEGDEILRRVRETIDTLPPRLKEFLYLDLVHRAPPEEIMQQLGLRSLRAFKRLKRLAFMGLRDRLIESLGGSAP